MSKTDAVLERLDKGLDEAIERLFQLVKIESISTDPAYSEQCRKAAELLAADLGSIGFDAKVHKTTGHPMVLAKHHKQPDMPHVLFYGHYDVQPVDPIDLWETPPFEPSIVETADGKKQLRGRGTSDDKGQLMTFVEAARAWIDETGELPLNVTILFEGEEESGSPSLPAFLDAFKEELKADVALVCDTGMWDEDTPAISTGLRGLMGDEIFIQAADRDLHSGMYGSAAANPIHILTSILAELRDAEGRITLDGFYDGVHEVPEEIREQWRELERGRPHMLSEIGLSVPAGEKGYSALEQTWSRPTAEVNGIWGGYQGEGAKTVIPAKAGAKITFRLVGDQDPGQIRASFRSFVTARIPADCTVEFKENGGSPGITLDHTLPEFQKATTALHEEWGRDTALIAMGGSIPIVGDFQKVLGMDSLLIGFAHADDRIHSPNEKYDLKSFHKGMRSWARILQALAE